MRLQEGGMTPLLVPLPLLVLVVSLLFLLPSLPLVTSPPRPEAPWKACMTCMPSGNRRPRGLLEGLPHHFRT